MSQAAALVGTDVRDILRNHFGFRRFRRGQREVVEAAIGGRDSIVIMPTGSGKSLCFQLPALALPGTTVVVSPLIALMKDQADALRERGVAVATVNSSLSAAERRQAEEDIAAGEIDFIYTTPERLADPAFRALLKTQKKIDLFVVDEAHCLSHWGHDFRPEYLGLGPVIDDLGRPPVLALTATATSDVIDDIRRQLGIDDAEIVHTGFDRENLFLSVEPVADEPERRARIVQLLKETEGNGIIYTATVKAVGELTEFLSGQGFAVASYHGRMKADERTANQDRFMNGELKAIVATNAFGLGIDKPDIRFVIHHHLPPNIESYYQEIGRAGRDGLPASGILLYLPGDKALIRFFQAGKYPCGEDLVNAHHALKRLAGGPNPPTLAELQAISPLPKARLKVVLALFRGRNIIREDEEGRLILLQPNLTPDDLHRSGRDYQDRDERDKLKQRLMVEYAEGRGCRWASLLSYFGEENPPERCGHCDDCAAIPEALSA